MNTDQAKVLDVENVDANTTPLAVEAVGQGSDSGTPSPTSQDADADAALRKQLEKYEQDIRKLKSTGDKRFAEAEQNWQKRENELRREMQELRLASLDEAGREKYLQQIEKERMQSLETKATESDKIRAEYDASLKAIDYYTKLGVPLSELTMGEGYDALFQSGFKYVSERFKAIAENPEPVKNDPKAPPPAPEVAKVSGTTPHLKPTMTDLVKKYGSLDEVFRLVENGRLDPSIIPLE